METVLAKVIQHLGSQSELARGLGIKPQAVQQWNCIPPRHALEIERLTGGVVTVREILEEHQQQAA